MDKLVIAGVREEVDGSYDFDADGFTNFELHAIKKLTELTAGEIGAAYARLDNDLIVALGMVVLMREGKIEGRQPWSSPQVTALWDAPVGSIYLESEEVEADPPASTPDAPLVLAESESKNGSSGDSLSPASGLPESDLSLTGGLT